MRRFLRGSPPAQPERSVRLRRVVLWAMVVPLVAVARTTGLWLPALLAGAAIALGHWYSLRSLDGRNRLVQGAMFVAIHLALVWMCVGLGTGLPFPQAQFAMLAQAITSFDLRQRRSLWATLGNSVATLYIAASLSRTWELGLYLVAFVALVLAAFFVAEQEDGQRAARLLPQAAPPSTRARWPLRGLAWRFAAAALGASVAIFLVTPRFAGRPLVPPFSISVPLRGGVRSEIINPGLPLVQINGWSNGTSDYYYGFDTNLDLRYRGGLSDAMVMYVRSPSRSLWRSHSYDFYNGTTWAQSDTTLRPVRARRGVVYQLPFDGRGTQEPIVQSFTLARDQPNLVFAAPRPAELYVASQGVALDSGDGVRLPEPLRAGLTYSVVSYRPEWQPERLRASPADAPAAIRARYLQLPDNISPRVRALARELTDAQPTPYDKVAALTDHLRATYPYNFFPPPHPPGAEVVDNFLFVDREGVCEQYVTALVVMARSLGIPARLVTGYGSGDLNPITGYYEVRASDAHAWAEVYFADFGWVPFDPTPGWTPQPYPTPVQQWLFSGAGLALDLPLGELAAAGAAGLGRMSPAAGLLAAIAGMAGLAWLLRRPLRRRWQRPPAARYSQPPEAARRAILKRYHAGAALLARRARRREPAETLAEFAQRLPRLPAFLRLTAAAERAAYRPAPPDATALSDADAALAALRDEVKTMTSDE